MNRRSLLAGAASFGALLGLPHPLYAQQAQAATPAVILVHGAMHGAWCWYKVVPRLAAAGVTALAIDLPGRGRNPLALAEQTREAYLACIFQAMEQINGPLILVGHDVSGLLISLIAEARPDRIARLVYLAAFLPKDGESLMSLVQRDSESLATRRVVRNRDRSVMSLRTDALQEVLYADCDEYDRALAQLSLVPEATQPFGAPLALTAARFGTVAKSYIVCSQDRSVGPSLQRSMSESCAHRVTLDCGHAPFFAMPDPLVSAMMAVAI